MVLSQTNRLTEDMVWCTSNQFMSQLGWKGVPNDCQCCKTCMGSGIPEFLTLFQPGGVGAGGANSVHHLLLAPPIFSTSGFPATVLLKKFKYSKESLKVMEKTCPKLLTGVLIRNG